MMNVEKIKMTLRAHREELRAKFKVKQIGIFGSFVRGEHKKGSDIDILVEFEEPIGLFEFMDLVLERFASLFLFIWEKR